VGQGGVALCHFGSSQLRLKFHSIFLPISI
jgi:hypothetical protein